MNKILLTNDQLDILRTDDWGEIEDWLDKETQSTSFIHEFFLHAVSYGSPQSVAYMLRRNCITDKSVLDQSVFYALGVGNYACLAIVLEYGGNINGFWNGGTPLHHVIMRQWEYKVLVDDLIKYEIGSMPTTTQILLDFHPDLALKNDMHLTPYEFALRMGQHDIAQLIKDYELKKMM